MYLQNYCITEQKENVTSNIKKLLYGNNIMCRSLDIL